MVSKGFHLSAAKCSKIIVDMATTSTCEATMDDMMSITMPNLDKRTMKSNGVQRSKLLKCEENRRTTTALHTHQPPRRRTWTKSLYMSASQICTVFLFVILVNILQEAQTTAPKYSQLLSTNGQLSEMSDGNGEDTFRPFIPKDPAAISRSVFTPTGQFRVFQPVESDLRATVALARAAQGHNQEAANKPYNKSNQPHTESAPVEVHTKQDNDDIRQSYNKTDVLSHRHAQVNIDDDSLNTIQQNDDLTSDLRSLEDLLVEYVQNFFEKGQYKPMPGLIVELQNNHSDATENSLQEKSRPVRHTGPTGAKVSLDMPRTLATGRLLFLTGLKKVLWPVFMGLQVLKSLLIAMFIPALIGSFTKLLGKGISTGSAPLFIRPMDPPQELDFRDNFGADGDKFLAGDEGINDPFMPTDDHKPYAYNQPDASQYSNQYAYNSVSPASHMSPLSFTRLGMNERQHQLMQNSYMGALQTITSASFKNSNSISGGSSSLSAPMVNKPAAPANMDNFQQFQKVPASSLLLSNYDPFYSPLLSRLDSVFGQLKLNSDNEECREKVICLMYANPAKYAPYSNLVSAQLSRELNELRKPTSDNPDILRFFKYMRAAKDGQDGVECEKAFDKCTEFKDFENPAMVSTYHDINKLVQARKMT